MVQLYEKELHHLGAEANQIRERLYGRKTYFNINRHLNPTNICKDVCKFCAFSAHRKNPNPYTYSIEEAVQIVREAVQRGAKEIHIVSAHNPAVGYNYYLEIVRQIRREFPSLHIKAFTAAEIHFFHQLTGKSYQEILDDLIEVGVDSLPGGGAEIFGEKVRAKICKGKVSSENWLQIHRLWHLRGRKSNATMLFGHIESREDRIDHMLRLKALQEETGGFNAFIPLVYQRRNNFLKVERFLTGVEILKTFAIARILLNSIPHIKAYWVTTTLPLALVAQSYGADDLDGTIQRESINSAAGADSRNGLPVSQLVTAIKDSGYIPVERDSLYRELKIWE
ncbi:MAG: aminofutalosine synthase MqnE [Campylobacterales bacterium]